MTLLLKLTDTGARTCTHTHVCAHAHIAMQSGIPEMVTY